MLVSSTLPVYILFIKMHKLQFLTRMLLPYSRRACIRFASSITDDRIKKCYQILNIPLNASQDTVREAFLQLAKKYHPDSGHEAASVDKFCEIEDAFRDLTKSAGSTEDEDFVIEYDIKHTAPQHRQYLSHGGVGYGTPSQRERQHAEARARRAVDGVMRHRVSRAAADAGAVLDKRGEKHDIKTQYGFDRLVEDLIQEAMSKGEFDNLSGVGKPLKGQSYNPYVDFTTHKINEMLINNGFTPEWITLNKDIKEEIDWLKERLRSERARLGGPPLCEDDAERWKKLCDYLREHTKIINSKITSFNLIVPLLNQQMFLLKFDEIADDVLKNGQFDPAKRIERKKDVKRANSDDLLIQALKTVSDIFTIISKLVNRAKASKFKE